MYLISYHTLEGGQWLAAGEDLGDNLIGARAKFKMLAPTFLQYTKRIEELKTVPSSAGAFVDYLNDEGRDPKAFLLDATANHRIVVYGEIHRRKASWDLWRRTIKEPAFVENVGTIFMELSADRQADMDAFLASKELDREIVLSIFRDVQLAGWYDKGMYEFLIDLWEVNKGLPRESKIKVVLSDIPRPFGLLKTSEEMEAHFSSILDRDEHMAKIIRETIQGQGSKRNNVFIVGAAHAFKSPVPGLEARGAKREAMRSAAARLVKIFSDEDVFSIFQHCPSISNDGTLHGKVRHAFFDQVFKQFGNKTVAFKLKESPFGKEPFDALYEIAYHERVGRYQDNYDAYLFLEPLDAEDEEYFLYELFSDEFVVELKRRAKMTDSSLEEWFGVADETREGIVNHVREELEGKKRWPK